MYIRTESDEHINLDDYTPPYVKPIRKEGWGLFADSKTQGEGSVTIVEFETAEQATEALKLLRQAIASKLGWDANECKEWLSKDIMERMGYR